MVVNVVAIVSPTSGKESEVEAIIVELAKKVHQNEASVERYQAFKVVGAEGAQEYVVVERYADDAAFSEHLSTPYFQAVGARIESEGLLAKPLNIMKLEPIAGFDAR